MIGSMGKPAAKCVGCGKTIVPKAKQFDTPGGTRCFRCNQKAEKRDREASRDAGPHEAWQLQQAAWAMVTIPVGATFGEANEIIRQGREKIARERAAKDKAEERQTIKAWTYSVAIREISAKWVKYADSGIKASDLKAVTAALRKDASARHYILNIFEGAEPEWFLGLACDREVTEDMFYWFDSPDGPRDKPWHEYEDEDEQGRPITVREPGDYPLSDHHAYQLTSRLLWEHCAEALRNSNRIKLTRGDAFSSDSYAPGLRQQREMEQRAKRPRRQKSGCAVAAAWWLIAAATAAACLS